MDCKLECSAGEERSRSESKFPWDRSVDDNDVWGGGGMERGEAEGKAESRGKVRIQTLPFISMPQIRV